MVRVSLRPDPSKGVFETMLVLDGHPVELDAHLERLSDSVAELYAERVPTHVRATVLEHTAGLEHGKLRIDVMPNRSRSLSVRATAAAVDPLAVFPAPERAAQLRSVPVADALGAHKWSDRRLLEAAEAELPPGELPLLIDESGAVLEVSRASVFAARDGAIETPLLDGRILPGIARRQVLEAARVEAIEVRETRLDLADVLEAEEVFLCGSVRGVEPVASIDGVETPLGGELSSWVADVLRRCWLGTERGEPAAAGAGAPPIGPPGR